MNKTIWIGSAAVLALAIPALAQMQHGGRPMMGPMPATRAEVQAQVKAHFEKIDANHDGFATLDEVKAAHEAMKAELRDRHFKRLDTNNDGSISRAEFDAAHPDGDDMKHDMAPDGAAPPPPPPPPHGGAMAEHRAMPQMAAHMFNEADANDDGKVTLAEAMVRPLARFDAADTNKDGTLSADERKAAHEMMRGKMGGHMGHRR